MEFHYFPAHARGLFPKAVIAHLDLGSDAITYTDVPFTSFLSDKQKFGGEFGQLPAVKFPSGEIRS